MIFSSVYSLYYSFNLCVQRMKKEYTHRKKRSFCSR